MTSAGAIGWSARETPLPPRAAVGLGAAARALAAAVLRRADPEALTGVAGDAVLVVCGASLPWAPGVVYVGECPTARALWLPTTRAPSVHPALLERALLASVPLSAAPLAVLPDRWIPLGGARPISRARLAAWLEGAGG